MKKLLGILLTCCLLLSGCGKNKYEDLINHDYTQDNNAYYVSVMDNEYYSYTKSYQNNKNIENTYSVAKLFTAVAIGMCVDRNIVNVTDKFVDVMDIELSQNQDPKWNNVTIEMLLKHTTGFDKGLLDVDVDDTDSYGTDNYLEYVLNTPLPKNQGVDFQYTDASYYLLSLIVEKVSNQTLTEFLRPALVETMKFSAYSWQECPMGHAMGATGLYIKCEDMVKLGVLLLNKGTWKNTRIISQDWCDYLINERVSISNYGDGWFGKSGMYSQFLAINPDRNLAVALTAYSKSISFKNIFN